MSYLIALLPKQLSVRLQSSPVYSRIARGAFWALVGASLAQGLTLLSSIPVARLLGTESYGGLGIIQSTLATLTIFAGPVLGVAATKHIAQLRNSDPERAGRIIGITSIIGLIVSALMASILWVMAPFLASTILNAPILAGPLRLASLALFFMGLAGVQNGIVSGFEGFRSMAQVNLWRGLVSFPAMTIGACLWRLPGAVLGLTVISLVTVYANQQVIRKETAKNGVTAQYTGFGSEWRILYSFSFPALLSAIVVTSTTWAANAMLVNQPNGYAEMGIFNAANQWRIAILFLPSVLAAPVLPMLSESLSRSSKEYKQVLKLNLIITALISLLLTLGVAAASPWIMSAYGEDFANKWPVLVMLALSATFSAIAGVIGNSIWSIGKMWHSLALNAIWAVVFFTVLLFVIGWGALGLAIAYFTAYVFHLILQALYLAGPVRTQLASQDKVQ